MKASLFNWKSPLLYFSQALRGLFAIFVQLGCSTSNRG
jgi:hypothetical protein